MSARDRLAALAYPALLFTLALLFYAGDLGKYLDDWTFCRRDVETGAIIRLTDPLAGFFYRPLSRTLTPLVQTLLWEHDRAAHLLLLAAHAANTLLLWRLLRVAGCDPRTALAWTMLWSLHPALHEAVFWASILATSLATALFTLLALVQVRISRAGPDDRTWRWWAVAMPLMAFALCCLNEQPAMGIPFLPALGLAVSASASLGRRQRWIRAIVPGLLSGVAVLGYLALMLATAPPGDRAAADQWTPLDRLDDKAVHLAAGILDHLTFREFAPGALRVGWAALADRPGLAAILLPAILTAGAVWLRWWVRAGGPTTVAQPEGSSRAWRNWLVLFGLGVCLLGWLPAWMVEIYSADSRMCYCTFIGLACACAAMTDGLGARAGTARSTTSRATRRVRLICGAAVMIGAAALALMTHGVQRAYRDRAELEARQFLQLHAQMPDPPPRAVFIALRHPFKARRLPPTGSDRFDTALIAVWENPWCLHWFLRWNYRRDDLKAIPSLGWPGPNVLDVDSRGIRTTRNAWDSSLKPDPRGGFVIPWKRAVPLVIDRDGRVRLVTRLVVKDRPDGRAIAEFVPPVIARQGDDRTAISPRPFVFLRTSTSVEHNSEEETPPAVEHLPED